MNDFKRMFRFGIRKHADSMSLNEFLFLFFIYISNFTILV